MYYASIGALAIIIHLIINHEFMWIRRDKEESLMVKRYRVFLYSVILYYVADILWGFLYATRIVPLVYADTVLYFLSMVLTVLMWTRAVVSYLNTGTGGFGKFLTYAGWTICSFEIICLIINCFVPIMFEFDSNGEYFPGEVRYITLAIQVVLYLLSAVHTFYMAVKSEGRMRTRNTTVGVSGMVMTIFIVFQTLYPFLPMYSVGLLIGTCLIHAFVEASLRQDGTNKLREMKKVEQKQRRELKDEKNLARSDELTGVKNKTAYLELEQSIQVNLDNGMDHLSFAFIVCDINDLKEINDTQGHKAGDEYIRAAADLLSEVFVQSPIFRIGGDEFVVFLGGEEYNAREELVGRLRIKVFESLIRKTGPVLAVGVSVYEMGKDQSVTDVFERADAMMYEDKRSLKEQI